MASLDTGVSLRKQKVWEWCALVALTYAFVVPRLFSEGMNIVTLTYQFGAERIWSGLTPYAMPVHSDWYKYSPFFAVVFHFLTLAGSKGTALLWGLLNISVFWLGVGRWFRLAEPNAPWLWLGFLICAMELNGSVLYQQVNGLMAGMVLIGLAEYRSRRYFASSLWLGVATNIKVLPALFLVLCARRDRKYWLGLFTAFAITVGVPALWIGPEKCLSFHLEWVRLLLADTQAEGLLDIGSALARMGFPFGTVVKAGVFVASLAALGWERFASRDIDWRSWVAVGLLFLVLVNPRTESPTFVFMAPAFPLVISRLMEMPANWRRIGFSAIVLAFFFVSFSFTDLWPKSLWDPRACHYAGKVLGSLALWALSIAIMLSPRQKGNSEALRPCR